MLAGACSAPPDSLFGYKGSLCPRRGWTERGGRTRGWVAGQVESKYFKLNALGLGLCEFCSLGAYMVFLNEIVMEKCYISTLAKFQ